jgi:uncharacterized membrane protein
MKLNKPWLLYAFITTVFWGIWGAFSASPENAGFPGTLIYVVWSVTMIAPALIALKIVNWKLDKNLKSVFYGTIIGLTGAAGQLALLTKALKEGPAHLIFPIISLSPLITILLSVVFLKEKTGLWGKIGIILALIAIPLLSLSPAQHGIHGYSWLIYALLVFIAWGVQAYFMKFANTIMSAESIFFYMTITGLLLSPIALCLTNFSKPINTGWSGMYSAFFIQMLNSAGALFLVYAFRYGKAIIVSPLTNAAAPVLTIVLSLAIYSIMPQPLIILGIVLAVISTYLFSLE